MEHEAPDRPHPSVNTEEVDESEDLSDDTAVRTREQQDRIAALAKLAAEAGYASSSSSAEALPVSSDVRTRWHRRAILWLMLIVVVAGAGYGLLVGLHRNPTGSTVAIPAVLTLNMTQTPLTCPAGFVWSPDGRQLAVWGPSLECQDESARLQAIIFDATTGGVIRTIDMSNLIPARYTRTNLLGNIIAFSWSPDGKMLVAELVLGAQTGPVGTTQYGLLLMPVNGGKPAFYGPSQLVPQGAMLLSWNLHSGTLAFTTTGLPAAQSYYWTEDDRIMPSGQTSSGRVAPPNGYTVWQDGQISPISGSSSDGPPAAEVFTASPALWSPDGQEMVVGTNSPSNILHGVVALAAPPVDPTICAQLGLSVPCQPTVLPPPDAAFAAVLQALARPVKLPAPEGQVFASYLGAEVAWGANSKVLATVLPPDQFTSANTTQTTMTVLSTSTGKSVARYTYQCPLPNGCGSNLVPSWSPTGAQLGAFDSEAESVILWNTTALAH